MQGLGWGAGEDSAIKKIKCLALPVQGRRLSLSRSGDSIPSISPVPGNQCPLPAFAGVQMANQTCKQITYT